MKKVFYILTLLITAVLSFAGCSKEEQLFDGMDNGLTSFSITANGVTYNAAITGSEIVLSAPVGVDLSTAEVKYELCEHASIVPDPQTIGDWNSQHVFRIKSYSKIPREYTYSVSRADVSQTGNVQLLTQTDVDNFAKLGVTAIDGNLIIGSDSKPAKDSIIDIESLASVKEVRYNIIVNRSFAGGTLKGLENIEKCGGLHIGTIAAQIEFPALSGISIDMPMLKSTGDIVLNSSSIKSLVFEKLESVSSLYIASNSLVALKFPMLKEAVGGLSLVNNSGANSILPEITFPKLEKVGGKLVLRYFTGVTAVGLPKLNYVGGDVEMSLNSRMLEALTLPELSTVNGAIIMEQVPGLLKFSVPKIKHLTSFLYNKTSYGSYPLETLDLPLLETVSDEIYIRGVMVEQFTLPSLSKVDGYLTLWDIKVATSVRLPSIQQIGTRLQLYNATMLESLDISTLDTLARLELIGCLKLQKVKCPTAIGDLTLNYATRAECVTPIFEGLQNIDGKLEFSNDSKIKLFEVKNIKQIGTLKFGGGAAGTEVYLYDTEKIGTFELSSSNIVKLDAPKLNEVESIEFSYISALTALNIPMLKTVGTFSLSEHNKWGVSSARMTNLDAYSGITSIGSVAISYCNKLVDFTGLAGVVPTLNADKWSVSACEYNPTYQDMMDGKYVKP